MRCGPGTARGSLRYSSAPPQGMPSLAGRAHARAVRRRERAAAGRSYGAADGAGDGDQQPRAHQR
eukprot:4803297-Prymnesium_polylepis.1